jgi:hypothetical protein
VRAAQIPMFILFEFLPALFVTMNDATEPTAKSNTMIAKLLMICPPYFED